MINSPDELFQFLKEREVFPSINDEELKPLSSFLFVQKYKVGDEIFKSGDPSDFIYIVKSGSVQLNVHGVEFVTLNEGQIFGALGVIVGMERTSEAIIEEDAQLILVNGHKLFDTSIMPPTTALKLVRQLTRQMAGFIVTRDEASINELIAEGESEYVEFKSSLRMNLHSGQTDPAIENAILKTIGAFINSKGGTLLIGVSDKGEVIGLEHDRFENDDKLLLHFTNLVKDKIGSLHLKHLHFKIVEIEGKKILRVECQKTTSPAYVKFANDEHFYIRTGPSTTSLKMSQFYPYIKKRFNL